MEYVKRRPRVVAFSRLSNSLIPTMSSVAKADISYVRST